MTDKERLIELLQDCVDENVETDDPYVGFEVKYGSIADRLIADGWAKPEWISVKDRLPKGAKEGETSDNVIACTIDGEVTTGWVDALGSDKWWLVIGTDDTHTCWGLDYVTHWMPLPQPPKGE